MRHALQGLTLAAVTALFLAACSGGSGSSGSSSSGGAANVSPVANAGANQTVSSGATVSLNGAASVDADGTISSYTWSQVGGTAVTLVNRTTAQPALVAPSVAAASILTFSLVVTDNRGASSAAATVDVTVNPVLGNVDVSGNVTFARVPFATSQQDPDRGLWYAAPVPQPLRGVIVRLLNAATQVVVATGATDNLGHYTLSVPANTNLTAQLVARLAREAPLPAPHWDVRVQDGTVGNSPYSYTESGSFNSAAGTTHDVAIPTGISAAGAATGTRASGPFAILDTIYQAIQTVTGVSPNADLPALIVDWGSQSDGTFFDGSAPQHIALLADLAADTDEFDQHVIAHEFGHYIEFNFSRADTIGGAHAVGEKLDPRVAFGEGFGYAFAAIVLNDPVARDSGNDNGDLWSASANLENNPPSNPANAINGNYGCWCSESSVYSILWDLFDTAADANDTLALGFQPLWNVLVGAQKTTPAYTTIFSFISALKTARPGDQAAINTLVGAQNISTVVDAFGTGESNSPANVPAAASLPIYSTINAGSPVVLATVNNAGLYNKLGVRRFLSFTPTTSGPVTISVMSSNPSSPNPDFALVRSGTYLLYEDDGPPQPETGAVNVSAGTTYVLEVYECANGCATEQGTPGDYDLTVTIQ